MFIMVSEKHEIVNFKLRPLPKASQPWPFPLSWPSDIPIRVSIKNLAKRIYLKINFKGFTWGLNEHISKLILYLPFKGRPLIYQPLIEIGRTFSCVCLTLSACCSLIPSPFRVGRFHFSILLVVRQDISFSASTPL